MQESKWDYQSLATNLWEALYERGYEGMDVFEIMEKLDIPREVSKKVIRAARLALGEGDAEAIIIRQDGPRYVYHLSCDFDDFSTSERVRLNTLRSRLDVDLANAKALVRAHDGRTTIGKALLRMKTSIERSREDVVLALEEIAAEA